MTVVDRRARRRPGENRERLLEAGLIEFGLFGYHGAATAAIARRADVPQPHIYANFSTKQELFIACVEVARAEALEQGAADVSASTSRMLYQAVAALQEPPLHARLSSDLTELLARIGRHRFAALLAAGAQSLLGEPGVPLTDTGG